MKLGVIVLSDDANELIGLIEGLTEGAQVIPANEASAKAAKKAKSKPEPEEDLFDGLDDEAEEPTPRTAEELKTILTQVRDEVGADKVKEIMVAHGAKNLKELVADADNIGTAYAAAEELLGGGLDEDDPFADFDDGDDDLGGDVPDAETIKALCQKYAAKHGKEKATKVLKDNGLNTVRGLKSADEDTLAGIYKVVKSMES